MSHNVYVINGQSVVRVTRVLKDESNFGGASWATLERAADRGRKADRAVMLYIDNNLDESALHPVLVPYLEGWKKAVDRYGINVVAKQRRVVHPVYNYGGHPDLVIEMSRPPDRLAAMMELVVTELKCVATVGPQAALQLSAYKEAFNYELDLITETVIRKRVTHRLILQLLPTGEFAPTWCEDDDDFAVFLSCLNRLNWRIKHGYETL